MLRARVLIIKYSEGRKAQISLVGRNTTFQMRGFLLAIILLNFFSKHSIAQALTWESEDLENTFYYPEKKEIKNNNIKFKIDSNIYHYRGYWIEAFDFKGRLIGSFDHSIDSFVNPYIYIEKVDTLLRLRQRDKKKTLYMVEKFIYDKSGKIIQFDRFRDDFLIDGKLVLDRTVFFYEDGKISDKLSYGLNSIGELSADFNILTNKMNLESIKHYSYKRTQLNSYIFISELMGDKNFRDVDTFVYDKKDRIIKYKNFAKRGYVIDKAAGKNLSIVEEYKYVKDSVHIHYYTTMSDPIDDSNGEIRNEEFSVRIIDKNGLEQKNLKGKTKENLKIYDRMHYIFY